MLARAARAALSNNGHAHAAEQKRSLPAAQ